jgi:hypothetical protein
VALLLDQLIAAVHVGVDLHFTKPRPAGLGIHVDQADELRLDGLSPGSLTRNVSDRPEANAQLVGVA